MKYLTLLAVLFTGCSTCHLATGVVYDDNTHRIDDIVPDSPAEKAGIQIGGHFMSKDGHGHIVIIDKEGNLKEYDLAQVCVSPYSLKL